MTTTPPPMPEPATCALIQAIQGSEYRLLSDIYEPHTAMFSANQIKARDAQWMEHITSLEAENKRLRDALAAPATETTHQCIKCLHKYWPAIGAAEDCPVCGCDGTARTALENTK